MYIPKSFEDRLLHLHYSSHGSYSFINRCMKIDPTLKSIYQRKNGDLLQYFPRSKKRAEKIFEIMTRFKVDYLQHELQSKNISYLHIDDKNYPSLLKEIYDPPWILYYKGNIRILDNILRLSVVGTRHPSEFAQLEMGKLLPPLIQFPLTIVSGMALGIDSIAHQLSIKYQGLTIAVLAYGLDHLYPESLNNLKNNLQEEQLILTEYPPFVKPQRWQFPERNRIISGLSQATLVVEAKEKSGSLITSDLALQQGRDVLALPGRISHSHSDGTNKLIQQGAKLILKPEDIINEYL